MADEDKKVERRRGPDLLIKWVKWTVAAGWTLIIAILIIIAEAKPPQENFVDRLFNVHHRKTWDSSLVSFAFFLLIALYLLCIIAFFFNLRRSRRKSDRFNISVILLGLVSFLGIVIYVINSR